jgi:hypothetical protein
MDEMGEQHGSYVDEVGGEERHITTDQHGRAVVGPRRHASKVRKFFRGHTRATQQDADTITTGEVQQVVEGDNESRWAWLRRQWMVRFYDEQWHKAIQHTAADIMIWSLGLSFSAVVIKGAYWVVTL